MRILIVDDSALVRSIIKEIAKEYNIEVCGEASNGKDAISLAGELKPDIIIMDINMPLLDGLEATMKIMETNPTPIIIFSNELDSEKSIKAFKYGAVDIMKKPEIGKFNDKNFFKEFYEKLINISKINHNNFNFTNSKIIQKIPKIEKKFDIIVLGASTGGPKATNEIFSKLSPKIPVPIVCVQHIEASFSESYVNWLNNESKLKVNLVKENTVPEPGNIYFAPGDKHIVFQYNQICLNDGPKVLNQKPSVDVLFKSAASKFKDKCLGVLLTGMGRDGAEGCLEIIKNEGWTIVQDKETSTIFGMPKAAIELNAASVVLSLNRIPHYINSLFGLNDE